MHRLLTLITPNPPTAVSASALTVVLLIAVALVATPLWRSLRLGVTLVHELGHAVVGICCGRRFTGFVVRGDMSGHAVTSGPPTGFGRVATTWAGYPMPAIVGAVLIVAAMRGWAAPVLTAVLVALGLALVFVRSFTTVAVMVVALAATGSLWWFGSDAAQQYVLIGAGIVLLVGAWRHLGAVARAGRGADDPAVLARLTRVPRTVWLGTFAVACAAATLSALFEFTGWPTPAGAGLG